MWHVEVSVAVRGRDVAPAVEGVLVGAVHCRYTAKRDKDRVWISQVLVDVVIVFVVKKLPVWGY